MSMPMKNLKLGSYFDYCRNLSTSLRIYYNCEIYSSWTLKPSSYKICNFYSLLGPMVPAQFIITILVFFLDGLYAIAN